MLKTIISDTSCLILLNKIGELNILKLVYGEVIITSIIAKEYGEPLPLWIKILDPKNISMQTELQKTIDIGEASAIALALELDDCRLILDDLDARTKATELGLPFTGTIGVLKRAKVNGLIPALKPIFDKIEQTNFHYSSELLIATLRSVGE